MRSIKSVLVALMAVLAFGAVAASGASAHEWLVPCHKVSEANKGKGGFGNAGCTEAGGSKEYTKSILSGESFEVSYKGGERPLPMYGGARLWCSSVSGKGSVGPEGKGKIAELVNTGCKVEIPTGCFFIDSPGEPNGTVTMTGLPTRLVSRGAAVGVEVEQDPVTKIITTYQIESNEEGGSCGLPVRNKLAGSFVGSLNNATERLEFNGENGAKELKVGGLGVQYFGELEQGLVGGGKLEGI